MVVILFNIKVIFKISVFLIIGIDILNGKYLFFWLYIELFLIYKNILGIG